MIFSHGLHSKVLSGQKSEIRRPVKPNETHCRFRVGHEYGVQWKHTEPSVGRIRILAVSRQRLGDITDDSIKREGFKTREEFEAHWTELHGAYAPSLEVWAIVFVPAEEVRLLAKDSTRGAVGSPYEALGDQAERGGDQRGIHPETDSASSHAPEPERVSAEWETRFAEERSNGNEERSRRAVMRSRLAQMRQVGIEHIKSGLDADAALERAYEEIRRKAA